MLSTVVAIRESSIQIFKCLIAHNWRNFDAVTNPEPTLPADDVTFL
jgi:hypothetical protein